MFVLGIDPGLTRCGYGIVQSRGGGRARAIAGGVITTPKADPVPNRLLGIRTEVRNLIKEYQPSVVAIERVLFQVNVASAMSVGQAVGVVMVEGLSAGCDIVEYSPNEIKQAVAGSGSATKEQMEMMVKTLIGTTQPLKPVDVADAVAVALCHIAHAPMAEAAARSLR